MNSPALHSFPVCPFSSMIRERQRTVALLSVANVSSRVPSDWWKPRVVRARASAGESEGKSICARSLFIEGNCVVAFTCASSSPETVERFPKGKLPEPSRIIRLGEQSIEVERGRHVCVRTTMQFIRLHFAGRRRPEVGKGGREREIYPPRREIECIPKSRYWFRSV